MMTPTPVFAGGGTGVLGSLVRVSTSPTAAPEAYSAKGQLQGSGRISGTCYVYVVTDPNVSTAGIDLGGTGSGAFPDWPQKFAGTRLGRPSKANNVNSAITQVVYREADLQIDSATAPASADSGSSFDVQCHVTNVGTRTTRSDTWYDSVTSPLIRAFHRPRN